MKTIYPDPEERHDYRVIAVGYKKPDTSKKEQGYINLLMKNLTSRNLGHQTLTLFPGHDMNYWKSCVQKAFNAEKELESDKKTVKPDKDLFEKCDLVISDKETLLKYFTEDNNIKDLEFSNGGIVTIEFDKFETRIWRTDRTNVITGVGADGTLIRGNVKKGDIVRTGRGKIAKSNFYEEFAFFNAKRGNKLSAMTPLKNIMRNVQTFFDIDLDEETSAEHTVDANVNEEVGEIEEMFG